MSTLKFASKFAKQMIGFVVSTERFVANRTCRSVNVKIESKHFIRGLFLVSKLSKLKFAIGTDD